MRLGRVRTRTTVAKADSSVAGVLKVLEVAASQAPVVEFFYEQPDSELVEIAHAGGALVSWQLGSDGEAVAAERAGCDLIMAQGTEAGGHVRGKTGLLALLGEVLPSVRVPVVAAGGIGTGRAMAAVLAASVSAVRVGTRFVAAEEAGAHPTYVDKLIAAETKDTILTDAFSRNWPNAPHRVLRSCVEAVERFPRDIVGETAYPWAPDVRAPVHAREAFVADKTTTGDFRCDALLGRGIRRRREAAPTRPRLFEPSSTRKGRIQHS